MSKNGFSYYKAETDRFQDIKIKRLKKRYGCDGYAVYQYALNEIYRVEGCYIRWTEDQMFDCSDYWTIDEVRVQEVIDYCAEIGLFDTLIWKNQGILTARSIQNRYLDICKVSKKKIYIPMEIMLVEPQQEMKRPEPLPLFDATESQSASGMNDKNKSNEECNAPTVVSGTFRNTTETFRNTPECSGKFPEKSTKKRKAKKIPPLSPRHVLECFRRRRQNVLFLLPWQTQGYVYHPVPITRAEARRKKSHETFKGCWRRSNLSTSHHQSSRRCSGFQVMGS